jgi:ATP-binding cassette, subfamily B, bacterial
MAATSGSETLSMGFGGWGMMRSFSSDRNIARKKLAPGTFRRIVRFARPYAWLITGLVLLIAVDAGLSAANPLIYREIINKGVLGKDAGLIVLLALVIAGIAVMSAALRG